MSVFCVSDEVINGVTSSGAFEKGLNVADGGSEDWSSEVVSKPEEVDEESRTRSFYFR